MTDNKMTQEKAVLNHLKKHGTITPFVAFEMYGITRLACIIHGLRKDGYDIETEDATTVNRYGNHTTYAKYHLRR